MRSFKILRFSLLWFKNPIQKVLSAYPEIEKRSYSEINQILIESRIYNCGGFSTGLKNHGQRPIDVFYDIEWLQKKWAQENNVNYDDKKWFIDIADKQIETYKPDVLFFQQNAMFPREYLASLKKRFPFLRKIVTHFAFLGDNGDQIYSDILLVGTPGLVRRYKEKGLNPRLFYHYFDESIATKIPGKLEDKKYPISFIGTSGYGHGIGHSDRYWLLRRMASDFPLMMWLWEPDPIRRNLKSKFRDHLANILSFLPKKNLKVIGKNKLSNLLGDAIKKKNERETGLRVPDKRLLELFPFKCQEPIVGIEYYEKMSQSLISFHKHANNWVSVKDQPKDDIGAIRLFEATGVGSCLITDYGQNLKDLFDLDSEVVVYRNDDEAYEKIKYLLENPKEAEEIAERGMKRTLKDHTATARFEQFVGWLDQEI